MSIFSIVCDMKIIEINSENISITEDAYLYDTGSIEVARVVISKGVHVQYCFVAPSSHRTAVPETEQKWKKYYRHIQIGQDAVFVGTGVMIDTINIEIITEIVWDGARSTLDLLALARDNLAISIEGVARVLSPYRQVWTRVDQTNILIGTGARVRWVPRLEIATDDIEWGHSCRMHRLGWESLFYLTSRGLSHEHAETLLLNSEILRHLRTIEESQREKVCYDIHMRLIKKSA